VSAELIGGLVALIVALVGGSIGWQQIGEHGEKRAELRRAEEDLTHARAQVEAAKAPPADRGEASRILRARLKRLARRLRRTRAGRE